METFVFLIVSFSFLLAWRPDRKVERAVRSLHRTTMNRTEHVNGYQEFNEFVNKFDETRRLFVLFTGSKDEQGKSWFVHVNSFLRRSWLVFSDQVSGLRFGWTTNKTGDRAKSTARFDISLLCSWPKKRVRSTCRSSQQTFDRFFQMERRSVAVSNRFKTSSDQHSDAHRVEDSKKTLNIRSDHCSLVVVHFQGQASCRKSTARSRNDWNHVRRRLERLFFSNSINKTCNAPLSLSLSLFVGRKVDQWDAIDRHRWSLRSNESDRRISV